MAEQDDLSAVTGATIDILDCEVRAARFRSFTIPSRVLRDGISPGNHARIALGHADADPANDIVHACAGGGFFRRPTAPTGERLFVEVLERRGSRYLGRVVNTPVMKIVRRGQHLEFGPEHICGWEP